MNSIGGENIVTLYTVYITSNVRYKMRQLLCAKFLR